MASARRSIVDDHCFLEHIVLHRLDDQHVVDLVEQYFSCLLYTSPSPRDS